MHSALLRTLAPAKVNLCLHIVGRRADLYHELDSLVAFASLGDVLTLDAGRPLGLSVSGPTAAVSGASQDNLVLRAARALQALVPDLRTGHFELDKSLPVAAGLGGGSSDAAAALRLLAAANAIEADDPRLLEAAQRTGADVPVCLDGTARIMRGIGDDLDPPLGLAGFPAVLVNPRAPVETAAVFKRLGLAAGEVRDPRRLTGAASELGSIERLRALRNDLQAPAVEIAPVILEVLEALEALPGARLARMSGSGATCFALFDGKATAEEAARRLRLDQPGWWIEPTWLGDADCAVTSLETGKEAAAAMT